MHISDERQVEFSLGEAGILSKTWGEIVRSLGEVGILGEAWGANAHIRWATSTIPSVGQRTFTHEILKHCWRNNKRCWSKWNLNQVEIREGIKRKKTTRRISFLSRSFVMLYVNYIFLWMMEGFVWMILLLSTMINFTKVKFITCLWLKWSSMLISCKGYQLNF